METLLLETEGRSSFHSVNSPHAKISAHAFRCFSLLSAPTPATSHWVPGGKRKRINKANYWHWHINIVFSGLQVSHVLLPLCVIQDLRLGAKHNRHISRPEEVLAMSGRCDCTDATQHSLNKKMHHILQWGRRYSSTPTQMTVLYFYVMNEWWPDWIANTVIIEHFWKLESVMIKLKLDLLSRFRGFSRGCEVAQAKRQSPSCAGLST